VSTIPPDPDPEPGEFMILCQCESGYHDIEDVRCPSCWKAHDEMVAYIGSIAPQQTSFPVYCSGCNNRHEPEVCPFR